MSVHISVRDFRSKLKFYFEQAITEPIIIKRDGRLYELKPYEPAKPQAIVEPVYTTPEDLKPKSPEPSIGYPCCAKRVPCKHWQYDDINALWRNNLTGETREAT